MWNAGSGEGAYDADEAMLTRIAKLEYDEIKRNFLVDAKATQHPNYMVYQNKLMDSGMSDRDRKELAMARYAHAKKAKVGEQIVCPGCGASMRKASYQHVYCQTKVKGRSNCKDFINNWFDATRLARALEQLAAKGK